MRLIVMVFTTLLVAAITGFGSAWLALGEQPPTGGIQLGQWRSWPSLGSPAIDPYGRAIIQRSGVLPLGAGEGIELMAERDSEGRPLSGNCIYEVAGQMPEARIWTLAVTPISGTPVAAAATTGPALPAAPASLTSDGLLRNAGDFQRVTVSAGPVAGNWLAAPRGATFRLTLRLYDSPTGLTTRPHVAGRTMPVIQRKRCQ